MTMLHECGCVKCQRDRQAWAPGGARFRLAVVTAVMVVVFVLASAYRADAAPHATPYTARSHVQCQAYEQAMLNAGAAPAVAAHMAYRIAPRESGCSQQCVHDRDDHSCSWVGLNGKGGLWRYWVRLCGVDVRQRHSMAADARCAAKAQKAMGWRPWRT